jgi:hypothetical protein
VPVAMRVSAIASNGKTARTVTDGASATEGGGGKEDSVPVAMRGSASRQTGRPLEPSPTERQRRKVAEREGFEPSVEFPLHTLSKRAPSTTRTSLRLSGINSLPEGGEPCKSKL